MYTKFQEIIFIRAKVVPFAVFPFAVFPFAVFPFAVFPFDIINSLLFIRCFNVLPEI